MGLGDEILATYRARKLKEENPDAQVVVLPPRGLGSWSPEQALIFRNNPFITPPDRASPALPVIELDNRPGTRPYIRAMDGGRMLFSDYRCRPGDLFFDEPEERLIDDHRRCYGDAILIHPSVKRSFIRNNKDWDFGAAASRWSELVNRVGARYRLLQMDHGPSREPGTVLDVEQVETPTFRHACCVVAAVLGVVTTDGAVHHAAGALRKPAVVILGGRISPETIGYSFHENLFVDVPGSPCGMVSDCEHCKERMRRITPELVLGAMTLLWPSRQSAAPGGQTSDR